jgi:hypothetical protein
VSSVDDLLALLGHTATIGKFWFVFAFINVLNEELGDLGVVFWEVNLAFCGFLVINHQH